MKILLVNTRHHYGGGDSTYTFNLTHLLRENGHHVGHFAMQDVKNLDDPNSDLFVSHIDFKELDRNKNILTGLQVLSRSIYSTEARRKFARLLARFQPDIVHIQSLHAHITPSILMETARHQIPVLWTLHDFKLICPNTSLLIDATGEICEACKGGAFYQAALKRCKKNSLGASTVASIEAYAHGLMHVRQKIMTFISPSMFLREKFIEFGFPGDVITHINNFIPPSLFSQPGATGETGGYFLFVGRVTGIKGIKTLLEAAGLAPETRIVIAGTLDPSMKPAIEKRPANVAYVGFKSGSELVDLITRASAVVIPSINYENQPFSILEAFALGKCVISSAIGGMSELVKDQERGILVPPGNAHALAEAMSLLESEPLLAARYGDAARTYALAAHNPTQHYQQILQAYNRCLGY